MRIRILMLAGLLAAETAGFAQTEPLSLQLPRSVAPGRYGLQAHEFVPNIGALQRGAAELEISLPSGQTVVLERTDFEPRGRGDAFWRGQVVSVPGSEVALTLRGGMLAGSIRTGTDIYEIRPERGRHVLEQLNQRSFPECGGGVRPSLPIAMGSSISPDTTTTDAPATSAGVNEILLLSMYTPQARDAAGGVTQIQAQIQAAVDLANVAFANSAVNAHYTLAATALANHNDTGNMYTDLSWVQGDPATSSLRNQYGADLVSLIVNNGGSYCGLGYVMESVGSSFAPYAFQVTALGCAVGNLSLAHEHGHNLGMEHDPADGPSPSAASYTWSFGHYVDGVFRTVMSYPNPCPSGCNRVTYFSSPLISYLGYPTGVANQRDNARTANSDAAIVAAFRSAPAGAPPAAPSGLTATAASYSQINLSWKDNSTDEAGFNIQRSLDGVTFMQVASVGANVTIYSDTAVASATTYTYRVTSYNSAGASAPSGTATATTPAGPPNAPSGLTGTALYTGSGKKKVLQGVRLAWTDNSSNEGLFRIERCKVVSQTCTFSLLANVAANTTTYTDPAASLAGSGTYRYQIRAENTLGVSAWAGTQVKVQ